jgi:hypothetical protein
MLRHFCFLRTVSILLLWLAWRTHGFALGPSCKSYGPNKVDLTVPLKAAMAEAKEMAELARDKITLPPTQDPSDNSRAVLLPGAEAADLAEVKSKTSL